MRINHNIAALNTHRQLSQANNANQQSMEKLSSGLRINRAGDDAAGLAISEKMRGQIRGLEQAERNAQDGISMIQTAEGALNETQSILQRMRELATQSANSTNTNEDRAELQNEVKQLQDEINRIGESTEFNTQKLLNGNLSGSGAAAGPNAITGGEVFKQTSGNITGVDAKAVNTTSGGDQIDFTQKDALVIDGQKVELDWNNLLSDSEKASMEQDWSTNAMTSEDSAEIRDAMENAINKAIDSSGSGLSHIEVSDSTAGTFKIESGSNGNDSKIELYSGADPNGGTAKLADGTTNAIDSGSVLDSFLGASAEMAANVSTTSGTNEVLETTTDDINVKIGDHTLDTVSLSFSSTDANTDATQLETDINSAISTYNTDRNLTGDDKIKDVSVSVEDGKLSISSPSGPISLSDVGNGSGLEALGLDEASRSASGNGAVKFQIGANRGQTMSLSISDMRSNALGVSGIDISSQSGAESALDKLDNAIEKVSSERGKLGAVQNRLDHTINNIGTSSENLTAAESRIRDVDYASAA